MADVQIKLAEDLPGYVKGVTVDNPDGSYTVLINEALCDEARRKAINHELKHIQDNHFGEGLSVEFCEAEAEKAARYTI